MTITKNEQRHSNLHYGREYVFLHIVRQNTCRVPSTGHGQLSLSGRFAKGYFRGIVSERTRHRNMRKAELYGKKGLLTRAGVIAAYSVQYVDKIREDSISLI